MAYDGPRRKCRCCLEWKSELYDFAPKRHHCKACNAIRVKARYETTKDARSYWGKRNYKDNRLKVIISKCQDRARRKGMGFNLNEHYPALLQRFEGGFCELSGLPFDYDICPSGRAKFYAPSIDRRDAAIGYEYDNVRVICWGLNCALGNWGEEVVKTAMRAWIERN